MTSPLATTLAALRRIYHLRGLPRHVFHALDKGPTDTFYEMREIEVLDPDGHRICFAQDTSGGRYA